MALEAHERDVVEARPAALRAARLVPPRREQAVISEVGLLTRAGRRLPGDWERVYGYAPVLLETFVEREHFVDSSYKAANWLYVGMTKARGKLDRKNRHALSRKDAYLYPLRRATRVSSARRAER